MAERNGTATPPSPNGSGGAPDRPRLPRWRRGRLALLGGAVFVVAGCSSFTPAGRQTGPAAAPLEFGIYPGGPVGTIKITDSPLPENAARRLRALDELRGPRLAGRTRPFIVRLYESFTGQPAVDSWSGTGPNATTDAEIESLSRNAFDIDLVVRYQPAVTLGSQAVDDYLEFVRSVVQRYGPNTHVLYLQIANEVNVTSSARSSDGAFLGAVKALVWGVEVAGQQAAADGTTKLKVGFNWAYVKGARSGESMWAFIRAQGVGFRRWLGWVGLDDYPGTFSDVGLSARRTGPALVQGVAALRTLMRESGLPHTVPIHISETGYPTGPQRSQASQVAALSSLVAAANAARAAYNVSDFEWFDLRDSNSAIHNEQEQYGLLTDAYRAKAAFAIYRDLIAGEAR
jgi:hypothetical protein